MDTPIMHYLSLFSGIGGLDLGIERFGRIVGFNCRAVAYVEREAYAAEILATRIETGQLAAAPIYPDIARFDGRPFRGLVDIVAGGFPCQDVSVAGQGAGLDGERSGLWWEMLRVVDEVRPSLVIIENVAGLLADRSMDGVIGGLAGLGFVGRWGCLRAADVGAPHQRKRVFVVAYDNCGGRAVVGRGGLLDGERSTQRHDVNGRDAHVADAGLRGPERRPDGRGAGEAQSPQAGEDGSRYADLLPFPPGPDDPAWPAILDHWPELVPGIDPEAQPALRRVADGVACRMDRLRALGNAVVPLQAAVALVGLWDRLWRST